MEQVIYYIETRKEHLEKVKTLIIERLNLDLLPEEIDNDSPLFGMGLGLDSIDALELIVAVEEVMGVSIPEGSLHVFKSINSLVDFIFESKNIDGGEIHG